MTSKRHARQTQISNDHEALFLLPAAQRPAGAHLLNDLSVPTNVLSLRRVLSRLERAGNLAPLFWRGISDRARLISQWAQLANSVTRAHELASFYTAPLSRNRSEANPTKGVMVDHPLYAALAAPAHEQDVELLFCTILSGLGAAALSQNSSNRDHMVDRVAGLARRLFQGQTGHAQFLTQSLDLPSLLPPRFTPPQSAATLWLRLERLRRESNLEPAYHEFIAAWANFLESSGAVGTGFDLPKDPPVSADTDPGEPQLGVLLTPKVPTFEEDGEPEDGTLAIGPDSNVGERVPPADEAQRDAISAWTARTRSELVLPGAWNRFVDVELAILLKALDADRDDPGNAMIRSGLACGIRPRAIAAALDGAKFKTDEEPFRTTTGAGTSHVIRELSARALPRAFRPAPNKLGALYLEAGARLQITSPPIPSPATGSYEDALDNAYVRLRKDKRLRLTDGRIARQLVCEFVRKSEDPYLADLVLQPESTSILTGAGYYVGMPSTAIEAHLSFVTTHGGSLSLGDGVMGSFGVPRLETLKASLADLRESASESLAKSRDPAAIAAAHNAFTVWVLTLLSLTSSHRLVQDPFPRRTCLAPGRALFILQDKVVNKSHTCRFAVASDATITQWEYYIQHLRSLADRMHHHEASDTMRVYALLEPGGGTPAPFLFFLSDDLKVESISPTSFHERIGNDWPWHDSYHRHLLSWWLRTRNAPPELVHAHLGHWTGGREPFSKNSFLSPAEMVMCIAPHLDALLEELGATPLRGLPAAGVYGRSRPALLEFQEWGPLGPELRALRREANARKQPCVSTIAREALTAAAWSHGVRSLSRTANSNDRGSVLVPNGAVDQARDAIAARLDDKPALLANALRALRTHCQTLRNQGTKIRVPGAPYQPDTTGALLSDQTGRLACLGLQIRDAVTNWITKHFQHLPLEDRPALVFLSATVNGGLLEKRKWEPFAAALHNRHHWAGVDWLELDSDARGGERYLGDAITRGLLRQCPADAQFSLASLKRDAGLFLRTACAHLQDEMEILSLNGRKLDISCVIEAVSDSLALDMCGVALQHARGESRARSTSPGHFITCLANVPRAPSNDSTLDYKVSPIVPRPAPNDEIIQLRIEEFSESLKRSNADSATFHKESDLDRRHQKRLAHLQVDLQTCIQSQFKSGSSPALLRLTEYALHLTVDGGIQLDRLRPSTIHKYAGTHVREFLHAFDKADPAELDDQERTNVYSKLLKNLEPASEEYVDAMRYFDWYLCEAHDQCPADWRMLGHASVAHGVKPFCDFPILREVSHLLISTAEAASTTSIFSPKQPLSLMASSGLRSGEAYRLTSTDVLLSEQSGVIRVKNKSSGETKTTAGVRMTFLFPELGAAHGPTPATGEANGMGSDPPLFSGSDVGIPRSRFDAALKDTLVHATGDHRVRPHLLRHAVCSHLMVVAGAAGSAIGTKWLSANDIPAASDELRTRLTGRTHPTSLWSDAICDTIGHSELDTTLEYYGHTLDIIVSAQLDRWVQEPSRAFQSCSLGLKVNAINQRSFRRRAASQPESFTWLLLDVSAPSTPQIEAGKVLKNGEKPYIGTKEAPARLIRLRDVGTAMELLHEGATTIEIGMILGITGTTAAAIVKAIEETSMLLAPPLPWLESARIGTGALRRHLRRACLDLGDGKGSGFWEDESNLDHVEIFIACWRRAARKFVVPNLTSRTAVMTWFDHGKLKAPPPAGDVSEIRFSRADTMTGTRLSHLLTLAYVAAIRGRLIRDLDPA